jgi:hypothetical protein
MAKPARWMLEKLGCGSPASGLPVSVANQRAPCQAVGDAPRQQRALPAAAPRAGLHGADAEPGAAAGHEHRRTPTALPSSRAQ